MPRLLALIPEDGWAMVRDGEDIFFVRPPFRSSERIPISEASLADAIAIHGYERQAGTPDERWPDVIDRIRDTMARVDQGANLPTNSELLSRLVRSSPLPIIENLLDKVERQWLAKGALRPAGKVVSALLAEDRIKGDKALLNRTLRLLQRLEELREEKERRVPGRKTPPRIMRVAERPAVRNYKARYRGVGSSLMVGATG